MKLNLADVLIRYLDEGDGGGVEVTHVPTGIKASSFFCCSDSENRLVALKRLDCKVAARDATRDQMAYYNSMMPHDAQLAASIMRVGKALLNECYGKLDQKDEQCGNIAPPAGMALAWSYRK